MDVQSEQTRQHNTLRSFKTTNFKLSKTAYAPGNCGWHSHANARFVFVLKGSFDESYGNRNRACQAAMVIFRPPDERHMENYGAGVVCVSVDVQPSLTSRLFEQSSTFSNSLDIRSTSLMLLGTKLDYELNVIDDASPLAIEALLLETAAEFIRDRLNLHNISPQWLIRARDFIHDEYGHALSVADIAAAAGVHPVHLARAFRRYYRCTIADYVRRLRIDAACSAIAASDEPLAVIAASTGFSDQSHFCKTFKRLTNITPAEYRRLVRTR